MALDKAEIEKRLREGYTTEKGYYVKPELVNPETGLRIRTGGRKKGVQNKVPIAMKKKIREMDNRRIDDFLNNKASPLAFLMDVYNDDELDIKMRVDAAKGALPYVHLKAGEDNNGKGRDAAQLEEDQANAREALERLLGMDDSNLLEGEVLEAEPQQSLEELDDNGTITTGTVEVKVNEG